MDARSGLGSQTLLDAPYHGGTVGGRVAGIVALAGLSWLIVLAAVFAITG
jgi:hypothetical protein